MSALNERDWARALDVMAKRLGNARSYESWIEPIEFVEASGGTLILHVPDAMFADYLRENDYLDLLTESVFAATGESYAVELRHNGKAVLAKHTAEGLGAQLNLEGLVAASPREEGDDALDCGLQPDYGFDSFVKGPSNELAYAACRAVAESPGQTYNPMFIYGGAGLGKTHLLQAIGREMLRLKPGARVRYVTSETYINDLVDSIQQNKTQEFRDRYRKECDVLLIDDIQFLADKERTQTEFFHTFNALYNSGKQIVFTSDRFPEEISGLEERLRSRFQWGLIADIKPPEVETRLAILRKKAEIMEVHLPDDVAQFIASRVRSNIRRLEGALTLLNFHASTHELPITLAMAKDVLRDFVANDDKVTTVEDIIKLVATHFSVKTGEIKGERRHKAISFPRQVAMFLCREHTKLSLPEIGNRFGGRDHTTVLTSVRKIRGLIDKDDPETRRAVSILERQIDR